MSDLADCYEVIAARPDGLGPRDKLVGHTELSHRSACSAQPDSHSLVIGESELVNSKKPGSTQ